MYIIQRTWTELISTEVTENTMDGLILWGEDQFVIEGQTELLSAQRKTYPKDGESFFYSTKIKDSEGCAEILLNQEKLFAR